MRIDNGVLLRAVVCGSFNRHLADIQRVVTTLKKCRVEVLSPRDPWIAEVKDDFVFVESDRTRVIHHVQEGHFQAIRRADFVWLSCKDGHVGTSATLELGFSLACGVPIYAEASPNDLTLSKFVRPVSSVTELCERLRAGIAIQHCLDLRLDQADRIDIAHALLEDFSQQHARRRKSDAESLLTQDLRHRAALLISPELGLKL